MPVARGAGPASHPSTNPGDPRIRAITGQLKYAGPAQTDSAVGAIKDMVKAPVDPHPGAAARSAARKMFDVRWGYKLIDPQTFRLR